MFDLAGWYWYASIFAWLFFTGIGLPPCPEEAGIIYAAGVTAVQPEVRWWLAWPATIAGIVCADCVLYSIGRAFGRRLFEYRWVKHLVKPERRQRFEARFHEHGIKILLTARLLPPLRTGVFIVAGAIHFSFWRFLIADSLYAVFGVGLFFFGSTGVIALLHRIGHWVVYPVAVVVGLYLLYRYYRHLKTRELQGPAALPDSVLDAVPGADGAAGAKVPAEQRR